jgi:hypothetical protein
MAMAQAQIDAELKAAGINPTPAPALAPVAHPPTAPNPPAPPPEPSPPASPPPAVAARGG